MLRSVNSGIDSYDGMFVFIKQVHDLPRTSEVQSRYSVGWTFDEIVEFRADYGKEAMQLMSVGVIESDDISYYSYIYKPQNKLLLIYATD